MSARRAHRTRLSSLNRSAATLTWSSTATVCYHERPVAGTMGTSSCSANLSRRCRFDGVGARRKNATELPHGADSRRKNVAMNRLSWLVMLLGVALLRCSSGSGGSEAASNGVGSLCGVDTDCSAPLSCMTGPERYVESQCSKTCKTEDDCADVNDVCLDPGLCVKVCDTSSDCPSGTACNEGSWCQRATPGAQCAGTPTGCDKEVNCQDAVGCYSHYACAGSSVACSKIDNLSTCTDSGCDWDIVAMFCSGEPRPCSSGIGVNTCDAIFGCFWDLTCVGTPEPCESLDKTHCNSVAGCVSLK